MLSNSKSQIAGIPLTSGSQSENLDLLADCLEVLRDTIDLRPKLTVETRLELEEALAIAEAALRRAHMESKL